MAFDKDIPWPAAVGLVGEVGPIGVAGARGPDDHAIAHAGPKKRGRNGPVYKAGDMVLCIKVPDGNRDALNKQGIVVAGAGGNWVEVKFFDFHDGWGIDDDHWNCDVGCLVPALMENE